MLDILSPSPMGISISNITVNDLTGNGIFDILMRSVNTHIAQEYQANRLQGKEYATVYLGALNSVLQLAIQFGLAVDKTNLELLNQTKQLEIAEQQRLNLLQEGLNLVDQRALLVAQRALLVAQTETAVQQGLNLVDERLTSAKARLRTDAEITLINQKTATETAQVDGAGVTEDSVIGKQNTLYTAQIDGVKQDAVQKAAQILIGTWNARRTTDDTTPASYENRLEDLSIGNVVAKMMTGISVDLPPAPLHPTPRPQDL